MNWLSALFTNQFLIIPLCSWFTAQVLKTVIHSVINRKFDITRMFGDGGMPSGHSATVTSLAVVSALVYGCGSFEFAVTAVLAIIVCHDAMGVRLETGKQAEVINDLIEIISLTKQQFTLLEQSITLLFTQLGSFLKDHHILDEIRALESRVDVIEEKLYDCEDDYRNCGQGHFSVIKRAWISGQDDTIDSKGKALPL